MVKIPACPDIEKYESLARGQLPPEELESLVQHLELCSQCVGRVQTLKPGDTLVDVVRAAGTGAQQPPEEIVAKLIQRLSELVGKQAAGSPPERKPASPAEHVLDCPSCGKKIKF